MTKGWVFLLLIFSVFVKAQDVYKTPAGTKYHLAICRMVTNVSSKMSIENALKMGLSPCKICKPPVGSDLATSSTQKETNGTSSSAQCRRTTKAGSRCKHLTRIGNGYCFQHQP